MALSVFKSGQWSIGKSFVRKAKNRRRRAVIAADGNLKRLAVFVSGNGSNFKSIYEACSNKRISGSVQIVVSSNLNCPAVKFAKNNAIPVIAPTEHPSLTHALKEQFAIDFILLAGYLKLLPPDLIQAFPRAILNIHPALLPAFGGKGFYGSRVHKAVIASGAKISGATVHFVSDKYDEGVILDQRIVSVREDDTHDTLARRVLEQEHLLYCNCVGALCDGRIVWNKNGVPFITKSNTVF